MRYYIQLITKLFIKLARLIVLFVGLGFKKYHKRFCVFSSLNLIRVKLVIKSTLSSIKTFFFEYLEIFLKTFFKLNLLIYFGLWKKLKSIQFLAGMYVLFIVLVFDFLNSTLVFLEPTEKWFDIKDHCLIFDAYDPVVYWDDALRTSDNKLYLMKTSLTTKDLSDLSYYKKSLYDKHKSCYRASSLLEESKFNFRMFLFVYCKVGHPLYKTANEFLNVLIQQGLSTDPGLVRLLQGDLIGTQNKAELALIQTTFNEFLSNEISARELCKILEFAQYSSDPSLQKFGETLFERFTLATMNTNTILYALLKLSTVIGGDFTVLEAQYRFDFSLRAMLLRNDV